MWLTKLQLQHKDCPIVTRCRRFNVIVFSYPSTWYERRRSKYATTTCYFQSSEEAQKKKFLTDLKADKRITRLESAGDMFTYEINLGGEGEHVMLYHTKQIFFVRPVVNHPDGYEYWEVASWERKEIENFIASLETHMDICNILRLENSPLTDIYIPNVMPKLSSHQKKALELAYENGYYAYPRHISVKSLAKKAKLSLSTFQEHLRKAELRLLPQIIEYQRTNKKV